MEFNTEETDLPIPIYLNWQIVEGLLSQIEDGISRKSEITSISSEKQMRGSEVSGGAKAKIFGIGGGVEAGRKDGTENNAITQTKTEQYSTPTSSFAKLQKWLNTLGKIQQLKTETDFERLKSGIFVEFLAKIKNNPLAELTKTISQVALLAAAVNPNLRKVPKSRKVKGGTSAADVKSIQPVDVKSIQQADKIVSGLIDSSLLELVGELIEVRNVKAVFSVESENFVDEGADVLIDGEYRVLGKTIRVVKSENDSIDLLRNTNLSLLERKNIDEFKTAWDKIEGIRLPPFYTEVRSPAIQIIPIAIFI